MFSISNIKFNKNSISIFVGDNCWDFSITSKKYLKYMDLLKKNIVGVCIFDQITIDNILKSIIFDKSICLELSIIFLKMASIIDGVELFQYISDEYYLPNIVVNVSNTYVVCLDYSSNESFYNYLNRCSWNLNISDIDLVSSKYCLSILDGNYEYIDVNDFYTITDVLEKIYISDNVIIGGSDIIFDLAVSLGIEYVLIDSNSNVQRFFDIVKYFDMC